MKKTMSKKILSPLRRDGYKAGMIMMLIALSTMLLTTACSSEDDLVNNTANTENTINKGYALPVTVNVTRGGDATTRATYTDNGNGTGSLAFSADDKLFVWSYNGGSAGRYAGVLDWVSDGTFSGTIYTQNSYEGTIDALLSGGDPAAAVLLPDGYGDYGYLSTEGNSGSYTDGYTEDFTKAFVASTTEKTAKALAVEQLSFEIGPYTSGTGFALSPSNAILNFTITGLTASTNVTATIKKGENVLVSRSVTTDGSGNATFAMGIKSAIEINPLTLTVGEKEITITNTNRVFDAGKIYNISRSAAEQEVAGSYFTANSSGLKVVFSKGNLRYASGAWSFFDNQYDYYTSYSEDAWDKFGWSTSATTYGMSTSETSSTYSGDFKDWGTLSISNGGGYTWRTLTGGEGGEWEWIIGPYDSANPGTNCRASGATVNGIISNARYTLATINTDDTPVNGIILFPDGCKINSSSATNWGPFNMESEWGTKCTTAQWTHLEELGCVFLPAAGHRDGAEVDEDEVGSYGYYWSSSPDSSDPDYAHNVYFGSEAVVAPRDFYDRYYGFSVRLIREVEVP